MISSLNEDKTRLLDELTVEIVDGIGVQADLIGQKRNVLRFQPEVDFLVRSTLHSFWIALFECDSDDLALVCVPVSLQLKLFAINTYKLFLQGGQVLRLLWVDLECSS